ncbi:MAG: hypothetical protein MJE12_29775 [Alphaproteobacteria bacterium]|nr:hypothetical protein [Alphaproteobacteria bacterium]
MGIVTASLLLTACATQESQIRAPSPEPTEPSGERMDGTALLDTRLLPDDLKLKQIRTKHAPSGGVRSSRVSGSIVIGPALRTVIEEALAQLFDEVVIYNQSTEATGYQGKFDIVFRPWLTNMSSNIDRNSYTKPVHTGKIKVKFIVFDKKGAKLGDFEVEGTGSPGGGFRVGSDIPDLIENVLRDLRRNMVAEIPKQDAVERWRMRSGLARTLEERARNGDVSAAIRLGRIHEKYAEFEEAEKWFCMAGEEGKRMSAYQINCDKR